MQLSSLFEVVLDRMGPTDHELRSRYGGETFDVCYCDGACTTASNWFKAWL